MKELHSQKSPKYEPIYRQNLSPQSCERYIYTCIIVITIFTSLAISIHSMQTNSSLETHLTSMEQTHSSQIYSIQEQINIAQKQIKEVQILQEQTKQELYSLKSLATTVQEQSGEIKSLILNVDRIDVIQNKNADIIDGLQNKITDRIDSIQNKNADRIDGLQTMIADKIDGIQNKIAELQSQSSNGISDNSMKIQKIENDMIGMKQKQETVPVQQSDLKLIQSENIIQNQQLSMELQKSLADSNLKVELMGKDLTTIKSEIEAISLKQQSTTIPSTSSPTNSTQSSIEPFGPFVDLHGEQTIKIQSDEFQYFVTTEPCIINFRGKAVITLIATGFSNCADCHGSALFLKDRTLHLPYNGLGIEVRQIPGTQFIRVGLHPINLTMEFFIEEAGVHEFTLAFHTNHDSDKNIEVAGLSFMAKVMYYE